MYMHGSVHIKLISKKAILPLSYKLFLLKSFLGNSKEIKKYFHITDYKNHQLNIS